jgi:hypothetical protein
LQQFAAAPDRSILDVARIVDEVTTARLARRAAPPSSAR